MAFSFRISKRNLNVLVQYEKRERVFKKNYNYKYQKHFFLFKLYTINSICVKFHGK